MSVRSLLKSQTDSKGKTQSKSWAASGFRKLQTVLAISLMLSSFTGTYLLATDGSLWHLAVSHAYGLIAVVGIDAVLGVLNLLAKKSAYLPSLAAAALGFLLQLGDVATAPQYHMTVAYFASYLFGIWAYDLLLALQLTVVIAGVAGNRYARHLGRIRRGGGRKELDYSRRRFVASLFGLAAVIGGAILAASVKLPSSQTATTAAQTSQAGPANGAVANTNQLKVGSPVYFEYPSGYPNMLLKQSDGTLVALSMLCTHACCEVSYENSSNTILCPCHGSVFDSHGRVLRGPAGTPLPTIEFTVDSAGNVYPKGISGSGPCVP